MPRVELKKTCVHTPPNVCNPGAGYEPLVAGGSRDVLTNAGGDEGGDHAPPLLPACASALRMKGTSAALPAGVEHLGNAGLDVLVRVGETQIDAAQAARGRACAGMPSITPRLRRGRRPAENLAPALQPPRPT
jgi:hypothetical protein